MPKSIFKSRIAVLNLIVAIVAAFSCFSDDTATAVKDNAVPILAALGTANVVLRRLTKDQVRILPEPDPTFNPADWD